MTPWPHRMRRRIHDIPAAESNDFVAASHVVQAHGALVIAQVDVQRLHPRFKCRERKWFQTECTYIYIHIYTYIHIYIYVN